MQSDFDEIWYTIAYLELSDSQVSKYEHFFKFKMPDIRLKIVFLAMTQQLTARFQLNFVQGSSFFTEFR